MKSVNWQNIAMGVLAALLSLSTYLGNKAYGQLEDARDRISVLEKHEAVNGELLLLIKYDLNEVKKDVKKLLEK